eukprot:scaffold48111_cov72-Phaeocystis_antarctica.AAC.3
MGPTRPPRARRRSQSASAHCPNTSGTQGTREPHAGTLRCLAERAGASQRTFLAMPERPDDGPALARSLCLGWDPAGIPD